MGRHRACRRNHRLDEVFGVDAKIGITVVAQLLFWAVVWMGLVGSMVGLIVARMASRR